MCSTNLSINLIGCCKMQGSNQAHDMQNMSGVLSPRTQVHHGAATILLSKRVNTYLSCRLCVVVVLSGSASLRNSGNLSAVQACTLAMACTAAN
jgi:hypothetical protein